MGYLTSEQALADFAILINHLKVNTLQETKYNEKLLCGALLCDDDRLLNKGTEGVFNSQFIVLLIIKCPTHRHVLYFMMSF